MKVVVAGIGAFGQKHLDGLKKIDGVEVVAIVGRQLGPTQEIAKKYGIAHVTTQLSEALSSDVNAVILCTPTQLHAQQAIQCMKAGKHAFFRRCRRAPAS
jgi:2-hydroxy-4-carboxymuconate semialdehyde hemiacetal dehydrogenase